MLTLEQRITLKAHILATPDLNAYVADSVWTAIADLLNTNASPDFIAWKTSVNLDEIMQNGFDWTQVDNQTVGKARIWDWMFSNATRTINPNKANVRAGIDECWKGTAAMLAVRAAVYVHCKRPALRGEKLFATGTGTDASPASMAYEGDIGFMDVQIAMTE
jgi:hypothetical protein